MPDRTTQLVNRAKPLAPLLVILTAIVAGQMRGLSMALLVLAGGMLLMAIAMLWGSIQSLDDEEGLSLDEALVLGAPSAEEEKKRAVLRALKDLEYERSVGKVTEEDYATLVARYRDEAKRLLRILETEELPARERAEKLLERRLERAGLDRDWEDEDEDEPKGKATAAKSAEPAKEKQPAAPARASDDLDVEDETEQDDEVDEDDEDDEDDVSATANANRDVADRAADEDDEDDENDVDSSRLRQCGKCETWNDADARFCKHCGGPMT